MSSASDTARAELAQKLPAGLLDNVDFIETEEDAKAVEAATLKIQSTFRGKKFRSKQADSSKPSGAASTTTPNTTSSSAAGQEKQQKKAEEPQDRTKTAETTTTTTTTSTTTKTTTTTATTNQAEPGEQLRAAKQEEAKQLSKRLGEMQVNEEQSSGEAEPAAAAARKSSGANVAGPADEQVERAATKIQAGFKGYKTRKELEGRLAGSSAAGHQGARKDSA